MRDILLAIISLLFTVFLHSCGSSESNTKAMAEKVADSAEAVVDKAEEAVAASDVPIPDLYKGMADSPNNILGGLKVGDIAPSFSALTSDGSGFDLNTELKNGPVALVFYRGFWCGKCTKHLEALQGEMAELKERGLSIYAVTPETNEHIAKTKDKSTIEIPFIHDKAHRIMDDYKVTYKVTDDYVKGVEGFAKVDLAESHDADDIYFPVPATYLIGQDGKIFYAHYDHNYGNRATASDMLAALASI